MSDEIKKMDIKEFRAKGYLQEINRQFLHRLGLGLEVIIDDETGEEKLGGVWDYRDDPEGIIFDLENSDSERVEKFRKNADFINSEFAKRDNMRYDELGYSIEPIPGDVIES